MAISLTRAELAGALRVGDSAEETAEVERLLEYAGVALARHLGDSFASCPAPVVNESVIRLCAHLYDMPTASRGGYANAMRLSGAGAMLLPWRVHRAGATAERSAEESAAALGLRLLGNETVDVTRAVAWTATALPIPSGVFGASVRAPSGAETPILLFQSSSLSGSAAAGGSAAALLDDELYALDTGPAGLFFASRLPGEHVVNLFGAG